MSKIAGRLKFFQAQWQSVTDDPFVIETIRGYKIPFFKKVFQNKIPRERIADREHERLRASIEELVKKGAVERCEAEKDQFLSSYFVAPKPDGTD